MQITLTINDKLVTWDVEQDEFLADTLRAHGYLSVKKACETSCCGLCTVWVEEKSVLSCTILSVRAHGKKITTIEGVPNEAGEFARVLTAEGSEQCGFCSPGFVMNVLAMKNELVNPSDEEIIHYLTGNLCRCTGYMGQLRAVKTYLGVL
ncbi:2Fe-2S iron-sulfur cluster binding domain-containing protein [Desulfosporosinus fructosivorans]|uniref:2Fe-2S iron-sulfur cluster binding domain-containing protein n=1 Tax=Desulfosporosinus fructosivorans TaxID=2018669 RepID=A0A4Z0R5W1_9FIRM|nr:2Fe-2S iron-sulfur cluster-binding protein [Desulfosporosinus fructosivorans]TGE38501.1 2Fe-2S iron-sulfur cluster binding domain-containing protein [Desulfosporosinus fructosivorans]